MVALSGVAASDVDTCETSSGVPACCKTTTLLPFPGFELGSQASKPFIIPFGPMVRLGRQSKHCGRMNNPDSSPLRPRILILKCFINRKDMEGGYTRI